MTPQFKHALYKQKPLLNGSAGSAHGSAGSAGSAHGSAGSAQWLCWLCSRLCSLITTFCHIAYIKLRHLWRVTAHDNSLFLILTNRSLILSAANSSNNRLTINQTPALQTNSIRSKVNYNVSSTFLNEFWPTESYLPTGVMKASPMALSSPNGTRPRSTAHSQLQNGMANSGPNSTIQKQVIKFINLGDS